MDQWLWAGAGTRVRYSWRWIFPPEPVWCLKQALGLPSDLWQRCTATRVKEHLSMCSDAASYPIVQCPPVPLLGKLSSRSLFTFSTLLTTDSKLSWKRYRWGRMLRQSLYLICPIILTSLLPFWPPLVPAYPLRVAASTTQSSPWFYIGEHWPSLLIITSTTTARVMPSSSDHIAPKFNSNLDWKLSVLVCSISFAQLYYAFAFQFL